MTTSKPAREITFPVVHVIPDELHAKATSLVSVQHTSDEFVISFFDVHMPALSGTQEENKELIEDLQENGIRAVCFARISVAAGRMPEVVRVMSESLERWQRNYGGGDA